MSHTVLVSRACTVASSTHLVLGNLKIWNLKSWIVEISAEILIKWVKSVAPDLFKTFFEVLVSCIGKLKTLHGDFLYFSWCFSFLELREMSIWVYVIDSWQIFNLWLYLVEKWYSKRVEILAFRNHDFPLADTFF